MLCASVLVCVCVLGTRLICIVHVVRLIEVPKVTITYMWELSIDVSEKVKTMMDFNLDFHH